VLSPQERALVTAQIEQVAREIAELNTPSLPAPSGRLGLKLIPRGLVANAARGLVEGASGGGAGEKFRQTGSFAAGSVGGSSGHSPPIFVQLPKADRFCGRLEAISRKFPLAPRPCHETRRPSRVRGQQNPCPAWLLALLELQRR
jgi:hypothetical protein